MKKFLVILSCLLLQNLSAKDYIHQVFILNEGYFDYGLNQIIEPVTIGVYDPFNQTYTTIDTIEGARFASDLVISDDYFYVAADNKLFKYDKNSYDLLSTQNIDGIRNIAVWDDKIIVSRGDYDNITFLPIFFNSYLQIYNTQDLSLYLEIDTISGPKWATQNLIVNNDKLYVAINNAYEWGNEKGIIGILDLNTFAYVNEIDLGYDGRNPDNMMKFGSHIYTINNKDWSGSSVSKVNILNHSSITINLASAPTGCGSSVIRDAKINYQISGDTVLYEWDIFTLNNTGNSLPINNNFYDLSYDHVNDLLYASVTDYFSYGKINVYDRNNTLLLDFNCGISPGSIVFDIRNITSIVESQVIAHDRNVCYDLLGKRIDVNKSINDGIYIMDRKKVYIRR